MKIAITRVPRDAVTPIRAACDLLHSTALQPI